MDIQMIPVRGTNCYLLRGEGGTILVDPGPPGGISGMVTAATQAGVKPGEIRLILVTHGHLDHYGSAAEVKAWCGAPIAAHRTTPAFSQDRRNALPPAQTLQGTLLRAVYLLGSPLVHFSPLAADLLLDDGADLASYGVPAHAVLIPGHAPGSLAVTTAAGDVFVGDLFVNYVVPSKPIYLSDGKAWQHSYERIRELRPRMVYVGHGDPFPGDTLGHIYPARYQLRWWVR